MSSSASFTELLASSPPDDLGAEVPYSQTAEGKLVLTKIFLDYENAVQNGPSPSFTNVSGLLTTLDTQKFPFDASDEDAEMGAKLKRQSKLATTLWRTLLAQCSSAPSSSPSTSSSSNQAGPPPPPQQHMLGDQRAAANEARKLAEELEKARLRSVCADLAGPGAQGGNFSNEFVTARASELFLGHAHLLAACSALVCKTLGISPFD
jgi:hypothetical protein